MGTLSKAHEAFVKDIFKHFCRKSSGKSLGLNDVVESVKPCARKIGFTEPSRGVVKEYFDEAAGGGNLDEGAFVEVSADEVFMKGFAESPE